MKRKCLYKKYPAGRSALAALGLLLLAGSAFPQCDPDSNGYVYLHPAFINRNWGKATYDSVTITIPDAMCGVKPAQYDICGPAAAAVAMFTDGAGGLHLMKTQYECPLPKPLCTSCYLDYFDPAAITLNGISLAANSPLYLVKSPAYGGDSVKLLVKTSQKNILAVSLSTTTFAALHVDTLKPANLLSGQEVFWIQGVHDSTAQKDTAVWLLGSNGLMRYFRIPASGVWTESNFDLGTGVTDTVLCVNGGFAGTSSGSIYKLLGAKYTFDNMPVSQAITFISPCGAAGRRGTFVDRVGTTWVSHSIGTADYRFANFINRWDGSGVELLDNGWNRTATTYRFNASTIAATVPTALKDSVNRSPFIYEGKGTASDSIILSDIDGSYNDITITLTRNGTDYNLKNDGKYTIGSLPPDSECMVDSLRLKSGAISLVLSSVSIQVSAKCELCQRDLSCPVFKCMRVDYPFVANHAWALNYSNPDMLSIKAGTNILRILYYSQSTVASGPLVFPGNTAGSITHRFVNGSLVFFVQQAPNNKLTRISLYNVAGQMLEALPVGNRTTLSTHNIGASGVVYARCLFSDGSTICKSILLVR